MTSYSSRYTYSSIQSVIAGSGGRTYTIGNAASLGGLFANGLPSKPSENKIRRANTSVTPSPASASPPQIPKPSFSEGRPSPSNSVAPAPPAAPKPADLITSNKPSPPPPPTQVKPAISSSTNGREQFKTMRPFKPEVNNASSKLRRSGSSEDFSSRESTPVRAPLTRPSFHPPARPTAPPPPPPIPRANGNTTVEAPPPPAVGPIASGLTSRFGSSPTVSSRLDESAPPPPPRGASKVASSIAPPPVPAMPKYPAKDAHPLDR
ncbi:hypothetical protein ANCCAN_09855 [Ancylostoma caninum]|uniref:WH2 domain-containing protein n=1 Tax=Ancylostoma caninum TaxID=29170 RepID=A0A368GMP1_ANCCA|nr:hypothetical protein ANCCAN_09855 [Ancylostoma caninum]